MAVCPACKAAIGADERSVTDKKGRVYHRACAKRLMAEREAKREAEREAQLAAAQAAPAKDADGMYALLDDVATPETTGTPCPSCGNPAPEGSVICTSCGYNFAEGQAVGTSVKTMPTGVAGAALTAGGTSAAWLLAAVGAAIGGTIGAAVWAAIAYFLNFEIGYVAVGVGALAGFGAAIGAREHAGWVSGLIALAIGVVSVFGGKFAAVTLSHAELVSEIRANTVAVDGDWMTREQAILQLVEDESRERDAAGEQLRWPMGQSYDTAFELDDYPQDIVRKHIQAWDTLSPAERTAAIDAMVRENMVAGLADDLAYEREEQGERLDWPAGYEYETAFQLEHYPPELVTEAYATWDSMTRQQQADRMNMGAEAFAAFLESDEGAAMSMTLGYGVKDGLFDLLWIVLAGGAAFGIGCKQPGIES